PSNARYRRELGTIYSWLGNAYGAPEYFNLGDTGRALDYYLRADDLAREFTAADPKNGQGLLDLAIGRGKLADVLRNSDPRRAIQYANDCLAEVSKPGINATRVSMRIQCLESLAAAEDAAGDHARAIQIRNEEDGLNAEKLRKSPSDLG